MIINDIWDWWGGGGGGEWGGGGGWDNLLPFSFYERDGGFDRGVRGGSAMRNFSNATAQAPSSAATGLSLGDFGLFDNSGNRSSNQSDLFNLLLGLGLYQKGMGGNNSTNLFSGIEV